MARIHDYVVPVRDQTGLKLVGRNRDGRYQYESVSVLGSFTVVNLTHEARVGLALVHRLLCDEWGSYRVYPMTRESAHAGYGMYLAREQWIMRPELADIGRAFLSGKSAIETVDRGYFSTVFHECGHNFQAGGTKPHGPEFRASEVQCTVKLRARLRRGWPKLNMAKLRDSKAPAQRKAAAKAGRRAAKAAEGPAQKWTKKLAHAQGMRARYAEELARAERLLAKWEKAERHAENWLKRVSE